MAKYALVSPTDVIIEFRDYDVPPDAVTDSDTKPRLLPVILQDVTFDPVAEVRVGPTYIVQPLQVLETYTKRPKNSTEIEGMRQGKILEVNFQADIHLDMSFQQQLRSLSRLVNLLYRHTDVETWPAAQQLSVTEHQAKLDNIDDVRQREAAKVAEVEALPADPTTIHAYDATTGWG